MNGTLTTDGVNNHTGNVGNSWVNYGCFNGVMIGTFQHDPFGRRASITIAGLTTGFLDDGVNPIQELAGTTPTASLLTGGTVEFFTPIDSGVSRHFLTDPLGSAAALADPEATVQTQYTNEPLGAATSSGSTSSNAFQETGRESDGTGLDFCGVRYYNPRFRGFLPDDSIGLQS